MECKEESCRRPVYCRGLCNRDYQQWLGRQEPRPAVLTCQHCGTDFPNPRAQGPDRKFCSPGCKIKYFNIQRSARPRPQRVYACGAPAANRTGKPVCAACKVDDRSRPYRSEYSLEYTLRQYGLTRADYDQMLAAQHDACAFCRSSTPQGQGRWHIDHDHVTGLVRGHLCNNCNRGIGYFGDDPAVMAAAAGYVARHRQLQPPATAG
jgi:Recombination endonuclease VII